MNPTIERLNQLGQSIWYDYIRRSQLVSGELAGLIDQGVSGMTSNPTIFEKAIDGSDDYDRAIREAVRRGYTLDELYDDLILHDIADAANLLRPVYDRTQGRDGFISLEVPPQLANRTEETIQEARRLFHTVGLPNLMIKVPATPAGIPAISRLIAEGINVNITLIFSLDAYHAVVEAYLTGLEERVSNGEPVDRVASVASFFVSRVDTLVDRLIAERNLPEELAGQAAVANAKLAYAHFQEVFQSDRFAALKSRGARVQRPLWASTSTKNPKYPELLYVTSLVGPDTVNTVPPQTLEVILKGQTMVRSIDTEVEKARALLNRLEAEGISMKAVTDQLLDEGVDSFAASFDKLRFGLASKRARFVSEIFPARRDWPDFDAKFEDLAAQSERDRVAARIWEKDPSLWQGDAESIRSGLGWLDLPEAMAAHVEDIKAFAASIRSEGFRDAVILGMGGSSLVVDLFARVFPPENGGLRLHVLDSTHPDAITKLADTLDWEKTLFIVASKSGTTTESRTFCEFFWDRNPHDAGRRFIAITDPGTDLVRLGEERSFRRVFLNPADVGGRFSALSLFGLVPAALAGLDIGEFLRRAREMAAACRHPRAADNPGLSLGLGLAGLAQTGHDKITFLLPAALEPFGDWVEQLLAESTGKSGKGFIPVVHEPVLDADRYESDRTLVAYQWAAKPDASLQRRVEAIAARRLPLVTITVADTYDVGREFFRWEFATAVAGHILGINAFNQPNVQESKENTKKVLDSVQQNGELPQPKPAWQNANAVVFTESIPLSSHTSWDHLLDGLLATLPPHAYLGILAYLDPNPSNRAALERLRERLAHKTGTATTLGFGPRFLHSTGQLHKGGPDSGVFLQISQNDVHSVPIAGYPFDFGTLIRAQAIGDYQALNAHGRPVLWIAFDGAVVEGLESLGDSLR